MKRPTEKQVQEAFRVLRADYYQDVLSVAEDMIERTEDGEFSDSDEFFDALHEAIDGNRRVFITFQAKAGLLASDNEDAAEEEGMEATTPEQRMYYAMYRDVMERIEAEGFDPSDPDTWDED